MFIEQQDTANPTRMTYRGKIFSIEEIRDIKIDYLNHHRYWIIPEEALTPYFCFKRNSDDDKFTVSIPVSIDVIMRMKNSIDNNIIPNQ